MEKNILRKKSNGFPCENCAEIDNVLKKNDESYNYLENVNIFQMIYHTKIKIKILTGKRNLITSLYKRREILQFKALHRLV